MQLQTILVYAPRRVNCRRCGMVVKQVPWSDGKCRQTKEFRTDQGIETALYHNLGQLPEAKFTHEFY